MITQTVVGLVLFGNMVAACAVPFIALQRSMLLSLDRDGSGRAT
ncbi:MULTISPECIES: hypothetical protein [Bradyrhizobium]|jgi:hypothetical protein|nr:hypothetical protein [Bradyrhizobium japonicum]MCP1768606.1 hypothetical protein [Bradyrhizobium japonicum]MCP1794276.1 hypothetical protein [Bradyrhizobium japonicum]MCP1810968.1 hypothetical protein [Bradyrhizobium japonicum]MCP1821179.1 hypothetical protein [Bradyrhizobium japonicum]MCP1876215.1 hypothetical protein [Bradyrhizobium japonicum]